MSKLSDALEAQFKNVVDWTYNNNKGWYDADALVEDVRALENELAAVKADRERMRTEWYSENAQLSATPARVTAEPVTQPEPAYLQQVPGKPCKHGYVSPSPCHTCHAPTPVLSASDEGGTR